EHARLDSMVLLLMKLDHLDQEIQDALSATSSRDSSPTLHRPQLQEFNIAAVSPNCQHPHIYTTSTSGPSSVLGAKPKCGVSQQMASQLSSQKKTVFQFSISASIYICML
ncbi:unnamed protein product, partial [Tetraodon nigroviridis]